jgi:hypothetical protein
MKIVLESQKEFLQGQNQVALNQNNQGQTLNINMNFDALTEKLKEVGASFQQMVGVATGSIDSKGNMVGFAERGDFLSGLLEGFGLDSLAKAYVDKKDIQEKEAAFVKEFEEQNKSLPVTQETLREIAKEAFRESRESITYETTKLVEPMTEENILEQEQKDSQTLSFAEDTKNYLFELTDQTKKYYPFIEETSKDLKELKDFIIANWGDVGGTSIIPDVGGGGKKKGGGAGGKGKAGGGRAASRVITGAVSGATKLAAPVTVGLAGYNVYQNEQAVSAGTMTRDEATKENTKEVVGTGVGLGAAALVGIKATALAAPLGPAAPIVGLLAGTAAFFAGDAMSRALVDSVYDADANASNEPMLDPESAMMMNAVSMPPVSSLVSELSQDLNVNKDEVTRAIRGGGDTEVKNEINNNVSNQTTVINQRKEVAPGNPDPTFLRFTHRNAAPRY